MRFGFHRLSSSFWDRLTFVWFCILIFCLPFSKAIVQISVVGILVTWFLYRWGGTHLRGETGFSAFRPVNTPVDGAVLFFLAFIGLNLGFHLIMGSIPRMTSVRGFFKIAEWFVLFYAAAEVFRKEARLDWITRLVIISVLVMVVDGWSQMLWGADLFRGYAPFYPKPLPRVRASFDNENAFATYLILLLPSFFMLTTFWSSQIRRLRLRVVTRIGLFFVFLLMVGCLVLTRTRSAWIGFVTGLGVLAWLYHHKRRIALALASGILAIFLLPDVMNLYNLRHANPDHPVPRDEVIYNYTLRDLQERMTLWERAVVIFQDHFWLGSGLNSYAVISRRYGEYELDGFEGRYPYAHNSYLQLAAELGILGFAAFLALIFKMLFFLMNRARVAIDSKSETGVFYLGILGGVIGFLVTAFFDNDFYAMQRVDLFWVMSGLAFATSSVLSDHALPERKGERKP